MTDFPDNHKNKTIDPKVLGADIVNEIVRALSGFGWRKYTFTLTVEAENKPGREVAKTIHSIRLGIDTVEKIDNPGGHST